MNAETLLMQIGKDVNDQTTNRDCKWSSCSLNNSTQSNTIHLSISSNTYEKPSREFFRDYEDSNNVQLMRTTSEDEQKIIKQTLENARLKKINSQSQKPCQPVSVIRESRRSKPRRGLPTASSGFIFNSKKNSFIRPAQTNFAESLIGGL